MANPQRICSVPGCDKIAPSNRRGWCEAHYKRNLRHGSPTEGARGIGEVSAWVAAHAAYEGEGCLIWPFHRWKAGYGSFTKDGRSTPAHRAMCEMANGPAPDPTWQAAHLCHNGHLGCVNPRHLEWQTPKENAKTRPRLRKIGAVDLLGIHLYLRGHSHTETAKEFRIARSSIGRTQGSPIWMALFGHDRPPRARHFF